jgi:hypothetical protein
MRDETDSVAEGSAGGSAHAAIIDAVVPRKQARVVPLASVMPVRSD